MTRFWLQYWPYQTWLPQHPEPVEPPAEDGRIPGLIDESN